MSSLNQKILSSVISAATLFGTFPINTNMVHAASNQCLSTAKKDGFSKTEKKILTADCAVIAVSVATLAALAIAANDHSYDKAGTNDGISVRSPFANAGLHNVGNTCYYNAFLQQLYSLESFRKFINDKQYDQNDKVKKFRELFKLMKTEQCVGKEFMTDFKNKTLAGVSDGQQDISETWNNFLSDINGFYYDYCGIADRTHNTQGIYVNHLHLQHNTTIENLFRENPSETDSEKIRIKFATAVCDTLSCGKDCSDIKNKIIGILFDDAGQSVKSAGKTAENFMDIVEADERVYINGLTDQTDIIDGKDKKTRLTEKLDAVVENGIDENTKYWRTALYWAERGEGQRKRAAALKIQNVKQLLSTDEGRNLYSSIVEEACNICFFKIQDDSASDSESDKLTNIYKGIAKDDGSQLKLEPINGQFAFFINRTGYNDSTHATKNGSKVDFGDGTLKNYYGKDYVLTAASVHDGRSGAGGHYYTYKLEADGNWYEYNDRIVSKVDWNKVKKDIEVNGVMFTYTEKSKFEESKQKACSEVASRVGPSALRVDLKYVEPRAFKSKLDVKIVKTGQGSTEGYAGITDEKLLQNKSICKGRVAIVDAANTRGRGGGGVDGAIFKAMGYASAPSSIGSLFTPIGNNDELIETGGAIIHSSFGIATMSQGTVPFVIQAVGPDSFVGNSNQLKQLYSAYYAAFRLAIQSGCRTALVPPISLGIFGRSIPDDKAESVGRNSAKALLKALHDAQKVCGVRPRSLRVVVMDHDSTNRDGSAGHPKNAETYFIETLRKLF